MTINCDNNIILEFLRRSIVIQPKDKEGSKIPHKIEFNEYRNEIKIWISKLDPKVDRFYIQYNDIRILYYITKI